MGNGIKDSCWAPHLESLQVNSEEIFNHQFKIAFGSYTHICALCKLSQYAVCVPGLIFCVEDSQSCFILKSLLTFEANV